MQRLSVPAIALASLALGAPAAHAQTPDPFFKGKTITIYIGFSAGGSYDLFGRLVQRHMGKHIPGNPTVIAQAMPGAGSFVLANWMYRIAPKDGTAIAIGAQTLAIDEALKTPGVQYKSGQLNWIGRATSNVEISMLWFTAKAKKMEDAKIYDTTLASTGAGSPSEGYPKLLNATIGTKFQLIGPYPGANDGLLAMERGETDGAFTSWNTLNSSKHDWITDKKVNILVQYGMERLPDMSDVPTMVEFARTSEDRQMFTFEVSGGEVGRSFFAPPGVPADRVEVLRKAFDDTMKDPELLAEVAQAKLDFHPGTGQQLQSIIANTASVPEDLVTRMQKLLQ